MMQGKYEEAKIALARIYDTKTQDIEIIFKEIISSIQKETSSVPFCKAVCGSIYAKGTWIVVVLIIFHELSGINIILLYSNTIFK